MKNNSEDKYLSNQSFYQSVIGGKEGAIFLGILFVFLVCILPATLSTFRLNLTGKYLSYAFVTIGLVLCWGKAGILSLGQGAFFGIGGYCMAMFLKLEASDPESTSIQTTPGIPDFMDWNQITELPWLWYPFKSFFFTGCLIVILPAIAAYLISIFYFKGRVSSVVFAILTQSIVAALWYFIVGNQGLFGGINGITDLKTLNGWDIQSESAQRTLYFVSVALLIAVILCCRFVLATRFGRVLVAQREKPDRVRFSGYDLTKFKVFIFCISAVVSSIGGALFTLQVGFMSPNLIGVIPSIDMVIFAAVGGRLSIYGAVYGTLLVCSMRTIFSEAYPNLWMFFYGALFIVIVLFLPKGLADLYNKSVSFVTSRFGAKKRNVVNGVKSKS